VYCLYFSMNCVSNSALLHKTAMYKIKLEEQEPCRTDKSYSRLLRFVFLQMLLLLLLYVNFVKSLSLNYRFCMC
jgi:hypothetical protein